MDEYEASEAEYRRYRAIVDKYEYRRRFSFKIETLAGSDNLHITGQKKR
jgi:hypothetical protein